MRLTKESLQAEGIYMLDTATITYIWVGTESDPQLRQLLFDCTELDKIPDYLSEVFEFVLNSVGGLGCG